MSNSRSKNTILNIVIGFLSQIGILLLSFIGRGIFVYFLSVDYLGINGLYSNILSVLSLAELGLGSVVQFFLYKPVAENDQPLIRSLMHYFKKLYVGVAAAILGLGLMLIPLLNYIVNSDLPQNELIIYYFIFLLNSVASYLSAHKVALLAAYQDNRLHKLLLFFTNFLLQVSYILILFVWRDYMVYVFAMLVFTIVNQILLSVICDKRYPYLKEKSQYINFNKTKILESVKSTFIYKIGSTIINNTDNLLISMIVNTLAVGLYSNYYMVVNAVQGFLTIITTSLISAIGNLSAGKNVQRMLDVFKAILLVYHFIAAYGAISFFLLFEDFISIWLGEAFVLDTATVFAIALNFYLTNAISPIWMFREANGLFAQVKYLLLTTAIFNIILSIIFGNMFGMAGVLGATVIARMLTQVWYEPHILFQTVFGASQKVYWTKQFRYVILTGIAAMICRCLYLIMPHNIIFLFIKAIMFLVVCGTLFMLGCIRTREFTEMRDIVKNIVRKTSQQI